MEPVGNTGRRLGKYHLGESLGGGPTGEVFRARVYGVAGLEREFALKRFHPELLATDEGRERLRAALRLYASLEHPRIARLYESALDRSSAYIAVELVAGLDLGQLIAATHGRGEPLPAGAATALLSRAARAVGYAHGRGLTHLGLCPTNLICTSSGEVAVTDFALLTARLPARPESDPTLAARLPYLAPEQLLGEPTSPATDVFQLGAVYFELLTGERAFPGRTAAEIAAAVTGSPPATSAIPRPLARVLDRCFSRSPFERFPGTGALADAIDAAARGLLMRGDRRDAARAVSEALERLQAMRRDQVSGALSFPMPRPPRPGGPEPRPSSSESPDLGLGPSDELATDVRPLALPPAASAPLAPPSPATTATNGIRAPLPPEGFAAGPPIADQSITTPFLREEAVGGDEPAAAGGFGESFLDAARPSPWGRSLLVAAALVVLVGLGFVAVLELAGADEGAADGGDAGARAAATAAGPIDAAPPDAAPPPTELTISSRPPGATVYLDGTRVGQTPVELEATTDRHRLALILAGHELHTGEIPGGGSVEVELAEVTPSGGRGGIKVRCRKKNRYYALIDGRDSGQLCPTERIGVPLGKHAVEIYDPITDTRRRFEVRVKQSRRSTRVRVD